MKKFFLFLFVFTLYSLPSTLYSQLNLTETKLATIPDDYQEVSKIAFSANGRKVAYKVRKEGKEFVVVGNQAGELYDKVVKEMSLLISPDGQRVAYQAKRGEKEYLVFNGQESKPYDDVSPSGFSPDGSVILCEIGEGGKYFILVNSPAGEKETPRYDYSGDLPFFSPDSRIIFYILEDQEKRERTIFAADARTLEVKKERTYAWVGAIRTNLGVNGLRFIYPIKKEKHGKFAFEAKGKVSLVMSDLASDKEKEGPSYDQVSSDAISPDGQRVVYRAGKEGKNFLVVSDWDSPSRVKENGPYDSVGQPVLSPNSLVVSYPVFKDGKWCIVSSALDGSLPEREGKSYERIERPVFSPDSSKIAYPAMKDGKWCVVSSEWDGSVPHHEGPVYDMVVTPIFSPDGAKVIYRARKEGKRFIVIADSATGAVMDEGQVCDEVWEPRLSGDGKFVCYGARIGRELWWKVESADFR
jgi:Tol biopolymer transport system component